MSKPNLPPIQELARSHGIQSSYIDNAGRHQSIADHSLKRVLAALGIDITTERDARDALRSLSTSTGKQVIDPVSVLWNGRGEAQRIYLPASRVRRADIVIQSEDGSERPISLRALRPLELPGASASNYHCFALDLPPLPHGYHHLHVEVSGETHSALLISAPSKLYSKPDREWGAFLPLYAAHSDQSWGSGNFSDWQRLSQWIGSLGGKVAGTLPIMAAFLDNPVCEPSPYSPASRLFWNEFFVDVTAIPEFHSSSAARRLVGSSSFKRRIDSFRRSELIDYAEQWKLKRRVLLLLAREFFSQLSSRRQRFDQYLRARPEVTEYAAFRAANEAFKLSWHSWPAHAKNGRLRRADFNEEFRQFYLYVQWIAQQQLDAVLDSCRNAGVKFYLDLPLGVNPDGFDIWRHRDFFAAAASAGAPPDSFFTKGQDWGFAPLHPRRTRELHYRYVIDFLRFQMRHTGLLRIDHVMGLHRLWWVPHGLPASQGAYVRYSAEELYAILSVESHRHQTALVGENLGTVPPEVNKSMDRHGLRRMYVFQYEQQPDGPPRTPERRVVASINTHDMPTFAAHWKGLDIDDRVSLDLMSAQEAANENRGRARLRKELIAFLRREKFLQKNDPRPEDVLFALLRFLASSPAETVLINLEDLWLEPHPQNVPGTASERPNWRRKSKLTLEQLFSHPKFASFLNSLRRSKFTS